MAKSISSIRNLGPAVEAAFAQAGINTAEELRSMGADAGYLRLLQSGARPHFIAYYALVMGLQGRSWNDLDVREKADLRIRFDALKAQVTTPNAPAGIEAVLDKIGVGTRRGQED